MKRIKSILITLASMSMLFAPAMAPAAVYAAENDIEPGLCAGAELSVQETTSCNIDPAATAQKVDSIIATVINIFSLVVGVVSVIMIIIGGLKYITSGGDSNNVTSAKNTILYAIIGLVIVALAQFIVRFVLTKVTG